MLIKPLYVPGFSADGLTPICAVAGADPVAVPDPGEILSQLPPAVVETCALQFRGPPPALRMRSACDTGLPPARVWSDNEVVSTPTAAPAEDVIVMSAIR